ncbi:hypothetical protein [Mesorhizobium sp. WSM3859]|uniref:hypothetical protein n=1 Tax=Mesorhizobium sp. WSM3859 TaxID=2029402 RepID=UPI000BAF580B|nr:hypothetical protein [Mesorhizobium sp. WSM3859]PBC07676.1 hypothetical protein CK230_25400 [Mesorhizobium sp. WSM3859]
MSGTVLWFIVVAGGPLILLLAIIYVLATRRSRGPAEQRESDRAVERLYREEGD